MVETARKGTGEKSQEKGAKIVNLDWLVETIMNQVKWRLQMRKEKWSKEEMEKLEWNIRYRVATAFKSVYDIPFHTKVKEYWKKPWYE